MPTKTFAFEGNLKEVLTDLIGLYLAATSLTEALRAIVAEGGRDLAAHDQATFDMDQEFIRILRLMEVP